MDERRRAPWCDAPTEVRCLTIERLDGDDGSWVTLRVTGDGAPVAGAVVTAYRPGELLLIGTIDGEGEVGLASEACALSGAVLTATGRDLVPAALSY